VTSSLRKEHLVDVVCKCSDQEHIVRFSVDASCLESDPLLWIYPRMNPYLGLFRRMVVAFKYVFNLERYFKDKEHYDTVWVSLADAKRVSKLLDLHACLLIVRRAKAARMRKRELNATKGSKAIPE
jgi:hypothetical protein